MEGIIVNALIALMIFVGGYWSKSFRDEYLPSFNRTLLALKNILRRNPRCTQDRFRVVLCWLENDKDGDNTKIVASTFTNVEGITLDRSARIVKASGAADDWQPAMQRSAQRVLEIWNADMVIVGTVKKIPRDIEPLVRTARGRWHTGSRGQAIHFRKRDTRQGFSW